MLLRQEIATRIASELVKRPDKTVAQILVDMGVLKWAYDQDNFTDTTYDDDNDVIKRMNELSIRFDDGGNG